MQRIIEKIRNVTFVKKLFYIAVIFSMVFYIYSIPAFSSRGPLKYITYGMAGILLVSVFLYNVLYKKPVFHKFFIPIVFFCLYALIGTVMYSQEYRRWFTLILMFGTFLSFFYGSQIIDNKRTVLKIVVCAFLMFSLHFGFHYRGILLKFSFSDMRLGNDFDNVNLIGFYFSIACTISLFLGLLPEKKRELVYLIPAFIFFVLGITTGSRSFLIVMAMSVFVTLFVKLRKRIIVFILLSVFVVILFVFLVNKLPFLKEQFQRAVYTVFGIGNSKVDTSTVQRIVWGQYAFDLGSRNIIFGYGVHGFSKISGLGTYAHNNFFEVMCDFGMVGFIAFYCFLFIPFIKGIKSGNNEMYLPLIIVTIFMIRSFFGVIYYSKDTYFIMGICYYFVSNRKGSIFNRFNFDSFSEVTI